MATGQKWYVKSNANLNTLLTELEQESIFRPYPPVWNDTAGLWYFVWYV